MLKLDRLNRKFLCLASLGVGFLLAGLAEALPPSNAVLQQIQSEVNNQADSSDARQGNSTNLNDILAGNAVVAMGARSAPNSGLPQPQAMAATNASTPSTASAPQAAVSSASASNAEGAADLNQDGSPSNIPSADTYPTEPMFPNAQYSEAISSGEAAIVSSETEKKQLQKPSVASGEGPNNFSGLSPYPNDPAKNEIVENYQLPVSPQDKLMRDTAFDSMVQQQISLTPEQVIKLHSIFNQSQRAAATFPGTPPKPVSTSMQVNLAPGSEQPVIRLQAGFVSSLVFLDSTGAPWPVESYDLGNPKAFDIQWDKKGNLLMVQAKALYTYGNMAVKLQGLQTPLMLMLVPGQKVFDYRVDVQIPGLGPNAKALPMGNGLPGAASPDLLSLLDGVPPQDAKLLTVQGGSAEAWVAYDHLYVRTRLTILSPGWIDKMSSADGMNAYELQKTPTLLASQAGRLVKLKIEGF